MWNSLKILLLIVWGGSFGLLAAAGVFTVFVAVGLIPRFAGKTHTAEKIILYEEMVIFGTALGGVASIFTRYLRLGDWLLKHGIGYRTLEIIGNGVGMIFGFFAGMFVGCLALAIAEMLNSIPIFARRCGFRHGLGIAILSMAAGKLMGALFYFFYELAETVK